MSVPNCLFLVSKSDYIDLNKLCEDIIEKLNPCSSEEFNLMSEEQQNALLDTMVQEIRKINVFLWRS